MLYWPPNDDSNPQPPRQLSGGYVLGFRVDPADKLGQVAYGGGGGPSFLGQQMGQSSDFSGKTAALIDEEVKILVERAYRRAKDLMQNNMPALHALADLLLEKENVDGDEFERMLQDMGCEQYLKADEPSIAVPFQ